MTQFMKNTLRGFVALSAILALSGCQPGLGNSGNNSAANLAAAAARPDPDERGVITYSTYQVMVARNGDTIASMAARVGLTPAEIANHNGLTVSHIPRPGEVFVLPRNVGGSLSDNEWGPNTGWSPEIIGQALDNATNTAPAQNPFDNGQTSPVIDPIRHRVQPGETAYSIARLYGVSVTALASWNGLDSDFAIRTNQEILIPTTISARPGSPESTTTAMNVPGTVTPVAPPPSAAQPLPEDEDINATPNPASPNLAATRTPQGGRLLKPVNGEVIKSYSDAAGAGKYEGIDIAAAAGTPVKAAADGEIAGITEALGTLGTVILIRHADNLYTVYSRVSGVTVNKGSTVQRGQTIAVVAAGSPANLHFRVNRGLESVDPMPYLP